MLQERASIQTLFSNVVAKAAGASTVRLHMSRRLAPTAAITECLRQATSAMDEHCISFPKVRAALDCDGCHQTLPV